MTGIKQDDLGVSTTTKIEAVMAVPQLYETERFYKLGKGRPRIYPIWLLSLTICLNDIHRGGRTAATELSHPRHWAFIRELAAMHGHCLPERPPHRTWLIKTRERHYGPEVQDQLDEMLLDFGLDVAQQLGILEGDDPTLYGDGKVQAVLYNTAPGDTRTVKRPDPETGELVEVQVPIRNFDPTAKVHPTGDGRQIHGNKFARVFVRATETHSRIPLGVAKVPEVKGAGNSEMAVSMELLRRVLDRERRLRRVNYDGAMHGQERDELQRRYGVTPTAPIAAKSVNKKTLERTEKAGFLRAVRFTYGPNDFQDVDVWYVGGWLCQQIITDDGTHIFDKLIHAGRERRENQDGTFRTYVLYDVPCPRGGAARRIRERTFNDDEDRARQFNRAENILLSPPGSDDYVRSYSRRSDAETANFQSDEQLHRNRARTLGEDRQLLDLWGHSFVQVAIALHRHRARAIISDAA